MRQLIVLAVILSLNVGYHGENLSAHILPTTAPSLSTCLTWEDSEAQAYLNEQSQALDDDEEESNLPRQPGYIVWMYIEPTKTEIRELQGMCVADPSYREKFNQLHSDLEAIKLAESRYAL